MKPERVRTPLAQRPGRGHRPPRAARRGVGHRAVELPGAAAPRCRWWARSRPATPWSVKPSEVSAAHLGSAGAPRARSTSTPTRSRSSRVASPRRRRCSPSGSTTSSTPATVRVGRVVMEAAAEHLTPVTLELGGKSPVIVDAAANLEVAARRIAWGKFLNAGQTCIAPDYVLVARAGQEELVEQIGRAIRDFYGPDPPPAPTSPASSTTRHFRRLEQLLADGTPAIGGETRAEERYVAPTVLRDVAPDSPRHDRRRSSVRSSPSCPSTDVDEAIRFVNERDRAARAVRLLRIRRRAGASPRADELGRRVRERDGDARRRPRPAVRRRRRQRHGQRITARRGSTSSVTARACS